MTKLSKYYTLLQRDKNTQRWHVEFGSFIRADVHLELMDYMDHGVRRRDLKIITTNPLQTAINLEVNRLNAQIVDK